MQFKDYYETLRIARSASDEDIKKTYRKLARKYHPDVNPNNKNAEEQFKNIQEAYEVLGDPAKRKRYDQLGPNWKHGADFTPPPGFEHFGKDFNIGNIFEQRREFQAQGGFSDFFESVFGQINSRRNRASRKPKKPNGMNNKESKIKTTLTLPLEEMHRGTIRKLNLRIDNKERSIEVRIPAGARDGNKIRISGMGMNKEVYIRIKLEPNSSMKVNGNDTEIDIPVSPWEAALGATIRVPTLDGESEVKVPDGISSGQRLRLKRQGLRLRDGSRGDHYVRLKIVIPKNLSHAERRHFEELSKSSSFNPRVQSQ